MNRKDLPEGKEIQIILKNFIYRRRNNQKNKIQSWKIKNNIYKEIEGIHSL